MKRIIAVIWFNAAWKSTVSNYISKKLGLEIFEISCVIKMEAKKRGIQFTRENLINLALDMAKEEWKQVLAERLLLWLEERWINKWIIAWMRVPEQLDFVKNNTNTIFIWVKTDLEKRFKRMEKRKLYWDPKTLEELIKLEQEENNPPNVSNTEKCLQKSDYVLNNNVTKEELISQIEKILNEINEKFAKKM